MASELDILGVFNFRDLASAAPSLRRGVVYRSDGLHRTDAAGAAAVADLGVRRVLDLRAESEQGGEGMFEHAAVETIGSSLLRDGKEIGRQVSQGGHDPLLDHYLSMLAGSPTEIARTLALVADSISRELPVVFHCTAGKDRTGVLAALILGVAGVDDDAIVADYRASAGTTEVMQQWYADERGLSRDVMAARLGIDADAMDRMMRAERSTMISMLAAVRSEYGGIDAFVESIGVSDDDRQAIRSLGT